ncbi:hypothetical protein C8J57DRAFT_1679866 [Mycena rebaudengoi]|nr:hypothetical protein C8J57DRAFT_1679866 [Mycena rebaudengoi]
MYTKLWKSLQACMPPRLQASSFQSFKLQAAHFKLSILQASSRTLQAFNPSSFKPHASSFQSFKLQAARFKPSNSQLQEPPSLQAACKPSRLSTFSSSNHRVTSVFPDGGLSFMVAPSPITTGQWTPTQKRNWNKVSMALDEMHAEWLLDGPMDLMATRQSRRHWAEKRIRDLVSFCSIPPSAMALGQQIWGSDGSMIPASATLHDRRSVRPLSYCDWGIEICQFCTDWSYAKMEVA